MAASAGTGVTGAGAGAGGAATTTTRKFKLQKENELRVEVGMDSPLKLQLVVGTAEIFGTELPPMFWMTFPAAHKFAVRYDASFLNKFILRFSFSFSRWILSKSFRSPELKISIGDSNGLEHDQV